MPTQKTNWLKIIIIVLVLAGIIVLGYFIYKKQIATTEKATFSTSPPPAGSEPKVSSKDNPNGPYFHQIYSATSTDGLTWIKQNKMFFDHASVPGAVVKNNKIYLYFVDASG